MSIIQVEHKKIGKAISGNRLSWQRRFKINLYKINYADSIKNRLEVTPLLQDQKNQAVNGIVGLINEGKTKNLSDYQKRKQFYDPQFVQNCFSPYSAFIPLQDQSYLYDEAIYSFSYMGHLKDTSKRNQLDKYYQDIHMYFQQGKKRGKQYVQDQWMKVKLQYLLSIDSVKAASIFIEILKKNSNTIQQLYKRFGNESKRQIFFYRVSKTSMYIKPSLKMHKNLKISLQLGQQINQKTLPMTMKTWYCPLCLQYDCQKHKLQYRVSENDHQYISQKNKYNEIQHIQYIVKLLKFYQSLKNQNLMEEKANQNNEKTCGSQCYLNIKKSDILRLNMKRFQLVTPLAKSLLKMGLQMFSYNPCHINRIFQSKYEKNLSINCNLIFIHLTEECNLQDLIHQKMKKSQKDLLLNESDKLINMVKIPINQIKPKKGTYLDKRVKNENPQFATCMHNFIGAGSVDIKCQKCVCKQRGFCLPTCLCTQFCQIKRIGCNCRGLDSCQAEKCLCFISKLECHPGLCGECFVTKNHPKKNNCRNDQVLRGIHKKVHIGISQIPGAGLGAFAGEDFSKNDLVCKYSGEHINSNIDAIREAMIKDLSFYNFDSPNGKASMASIDARFMGNKARFINHGNEGENNVRAENIHSNGTQYIALFAAKEIKEGEQLRFNYDGSGNLYALHRDKYPFIKPPKKN